VFVAHQEREEYVFLSDAVFASYLKDLSDARKPLVLLEGGGTMATRTPGMGSGTRKSCSPRRAVRCCGATKIACD
jgi:hypothetical protein